MSLKRHFSTILNWLPKCYFWDSEIAIPVYWKNMSPVSKNVIRSRKLKNNFYLEPNLLKLLFGHKKCYWLKNLTIKKFMIF